MYNYTIAVGDLGIVPTNLEMRQGEPPPSCSTVFPELSQDPDICHSFRFLSFSFYDPLERESSPDYKCIFFWINIWSGLLAGNGQSICIWKSQRILCISVSRTDSVLCMYYFPVMWNFSFLHNSCGSPFLPSQLFFFLFLSFFFFFFFLLAWIIKTPLRVFSLQS